MPSQQPSFLLRRCICIAALTAALLMTMLITGTQAELFNSSYAIESPISSTFLMKPSNGLYTFNIEYQRMNELNGTVYILGTYSSSRALTAADVPLLNGNACTLPKPSGGITDQDVFVAAIDINGKCLWVNTFYTLGSSNSIRTDDVEAKTMALSYNNDLGLVGSSMWVDYANGNGKPVSFKSTLSNGCDLTNLPDSGAQRTSFIFLLDINTGKCVRSKFLSRIGVYTMDIAPWSSSVFVGGFGPGSWTYQIETNAQMVFPINVRVGCVISLALSDLRYQRSVIASTAATSASGQPTSWSAVAGLRAYSDGTLNMAAGMYPTSANGANIFPGFCGSAYANGGTLCTAKLDQATLATIQGYSVAATGKGVTWRASFISTNLMFYADQYHYRTTSEPYYSAIRYTVTNFVAGTINAGSTYYTVYTDMVPIDNIGGSPYIWMTGFLRPTSAGSGYKMCGLTNNSPTASVGFVAAFTATSTSMRCIGIIPMTPQASDHAFIPKGIAFARIASSAEPIGFEQRIFIVSNMTTSATLYKNVMLTNDTIDSTQGDSMNVFQAKISCVAGASLGNTSFCHLNFINQTTETKNWNLAPFCAYPKYTLDTGSTSSSDCLVQCWGVTNTSTTPLPCNSSGICLTRNKCTCYPGYSGIYCDTVTCGGIYNTSASVCSGHGKCVAPNTCACSNGYDGDLCQYAVCGGISNSTSSVCNGRGTCTNPTVGCQCISGYAGSSCESILCFGVQNTSTTVCSGHGKCLLIDQCICDPGFNGTRCETSPIICGQGKFADLSAANPQCTSCPVGTFQTASAHSFTSCSACPSSYTTNGLGKALSSDCSVCAAGSFRMSDGVTCSPCAKGSFSSATDQTSCTRCPSGFTTSATTGLTNSTLCDTCIQGYTIDSTSSSCVMCGKGSFKDVEGNGACSSCSTLGVGFTTIGTGSISQLNCTCSTGYRSSGSSCVVCERGSYQNQEGQTSCVRCPTGYTTAISTIAFQSSDCNICLKGYWNSGGSCSQCAVGTYSDQQNQSQCTPCDPSGTNSLTTIGTNSTDSSQCVCRPGFYYNNTQCTKCAQNFYKNNYGNDSSCTACPTGSATTADGNTMVIDCNICSIGYGWKSTAGSCDICAKGTYKNTTSQAICSSCPLGSTTNSTGADNANLCNICSAGYFFDGSQCSACAQGTYQDQDGQTSCIPCGANTTTVGTGSTSCSCNTGFYADSNSGNFLQCSKGSFKNTISSLESCTICPTGYTTTITAGATLNSDCNVCVAGYKWSTANNRCEQCGIGTFTDAEGTPSQCISCPAGAVTLAAGSNDSSLCVCPLGTYRNVSDNTCMQCAKGSYQDQFNQTQCQSCAFAPETTTQGIGARSSSECNTCIKGYAWSSTSGKCVACVKGTYKDIEGTQNCTVCADAGSTTAATGSDASTACSLCMAGYHMNSVTQTCQKCAKGWYQITEGVQPQCQQCSGANETTVAEGSTLQSDCVCDIGTYKDGTNGCKPCPMDQYQDEQGKSDCKACAVPGVGGSIWRNRTLVTGASRSSLCVSVPAPPATVTQVRSTQTSIDITWSPPSDDGGTVVLQYKLYVLGTVSGAVLQTFTISQASNRALTISGLSINTDYFVLISAENALGGSENKTVTIRTSEVSCFGIAQSDAGNVCSGVGQCVTIDTCQCNIGRSGAECDVVQQIKPTDVISVLQGLTASSASNGTVTVTDTTRVTTISVMHIDDFSTTMQVQVNRKQDAVLSASQQQTVDVPPVVVTFPASLKSVLIQDKNVAAAEDTGDRTIVFVADMETDREKSVKSMGVQLESQNGNVRVAPGAISIDFKFQYKIKDRQGNITSMGDINIKELPEPIDFPMYILGTGVESLTKLNETGAALPTCTYWDTTLQQWSSDGVETLNVTKGSAYLDGTGNGTLFRIHCRTRHLTAFSTVYITQNPVYVTNWATLCYVTITFGISCICLVLFASADIISSRAAKMGKPVELQPRYVTILLDICQSVLMRHMWFSVPAALALGLSGRVPWLLKYQRLAIWWTSLCAYAIGTVGIVGSLRIYWNWQGLYGEGDLLGRDLNTLLAHFWVPCIVSSLAAGKAMQFLLMWLFQRFSSSEVQSASYNNFFVTLLRKMTMDSLVSKNKTAHAAANVVLFACCAVFITVMYVIMLVFGVRLLVIQGALFFLGTLLALLIDAVVLEPLCMLIGHMARLYIGDVSKPMEQPKQDEFKLTFSSVIFDDEKLQAIVGMGLAPAEDKERERREQEEEERKRVAAAEAARIAVEEAERKRVAAEQAESKRKQVEAKRKRIAAEEAERQRLLEQLERQCKAEEAQRQRIAADEAAMKAAEEGDARLAEEAERQRIAAEEAECACKATEEEVDRKLAEEEAELKHIAAEEAAHKSAEEEEAARVADGLEATRVAEEEHQ